MEDTDGSRFYTLEEYKTATEVLQKNKEGKWVIIYSSNPVQQDGYIRAARTKGYKVVKLETIVDAGFINQMEMKWENVHFTRVDSEVVDNLIDKQEDQESVLSKEEVEKLKSLFSVNIPSLNVTVEVKGLNTDAMPVVATRPEFMRRMKDMASLNGGMGAFYANMPDEVTLTVNGNHIIYPGLLAETDGIKQQKLIHNLADLALLSQGLLKGVELTNFIQRSIDLIENKKSSLIIEA